MSVKMLFMKGGLPCGQPNGEPYMLPGMVDSMGRFGFLRAHAA
jgi:hypothetical protein